MTDNTITQERPKILLLDDDQDLLDLYREILSQLPSRPEIFTSTTGARGIAMMEAEPFTLLVCDLNMPKMDGLQVLSIVRRKFPELAHGRAHLHHRRAISLARLRTGRGSFLAEARHRRGDQAISGVHRIVARPRYRRAAFAACKARASWTSSSWNVFPRIPSSSRSSTARSWPDLDPERRGH